MSKIRSRQWSPQRPPRLLPLVGLKSVGDQFIEQDDDRRNYKKVYQAHAEMECDAHEPQSQENNEDYPKHRRTFFAYRAPRQLTRLGVPAMHS